MSASSYGIITEGVFDAAVYRTLVRRLNPGIYVRMLACRGKNDLMKRFPGLLRTFEHDFEGGPVEMAVVIRDADGKDPAELELQMRTSIEDRQYPFRMDVRFHAVRNAMDAWLLADSAAIDRVCLARGGGHVTNTPRNLEDMLRPKESLRLLLSNRKVPYTPELCRDIAAAIDLNVLSQRCPRFQTFAELVDC